jgi:hypothetical protein
MVKRIALPSTTTLAQVRPGQRSESKDRPTLPPIAQQPSLIYLVRQATRSRASLNLLMPDSHGKDSSLNVPPAPTFGLLYSDDRGLDDLCRKLVAYDMGSKELRAIKDVLDGQSSIAGLDTLAEVKGQQPNSVGHLVNITGIYILAEAVASGFEANWAGSDIAQVSLRSREAVVRLVDLCRNEEAHATCEQLQLELELWLEAETSLLQNGVPKTEIAKSREAFLTKLEQWGETEQHIKNLAQRCFHPNKSIYDAFLEPPNNHFYNVIHDYVKAKKQNSAPGITRGGSFSFPSNRVIEQMRAAIEKLLIKHRLEKVDIYKKTDDPGEPPFTEWLHRRIKSAKERRFDKTIEKIKADFQNGWKREWDTKTLAPVYATLQGFPEHIIERLKGLRLHTLTPPKKKTKLMEQTGGDGAALRRLWRNEAAVREANKVGPRAGAVLTVEDGEKLREWISSYLSNAIRYMDEHFETVA